MTFGIEQYQNLAKVMRASQGRFMVTINDHPDMKKVFKGFDIRMVNIDYTVGGGGKAKGRKEMIILS